VLFKWLLRAMALVVLIVGGLLVQMVWFRPFSIDIFFERAFIEYALDDPELLSTLRILEPLGFNLHNDDLTDVSVARTIELQDKLRRDLETLRSYDGDDLDPERKLSRDVLDYFLELQVDGEPFAFHDFPVNPLSGVQVALPEFMANVHQVHDKTDARHYVDRLSQFGRKFDQLLEGLQYRAELGMVPPRFLVERVLEQMKAFVATPPKKNLLYTSLENKLQGLDRDHMDPVTQRRMLNRTESAIEDSVYPAYVRLIDHFEMLLPQAKEHFGAWALPDGDAYYAHLVRRHTTTELTPQEVHALGVAEVERIAGEMGQILSDQGLDGDNVGELTRKLCNEPRFLYPDTAAARNQVLTDVQAMVDEIAAASADSFGLRPATGVEVRRVPPFREGSAAAGYYEAPALDGSRPGRFFINLRDLTELCKLGLRTLTYHEAIPGHHFQIAIGQQMADVPTFRRVIPFTAFMEGWALYAEHLAKELGYLNDPFDDLGRLQAEMLRAVRLVVDTGLHAKQWRREQAIDYMMAMTGLGETEVTAEVERYLIDPGQALAYKVGMIRIMELRQRAQRQLGANFALRDFHDVVLGNGALPMSLLEREVDQWIAETAGG
jgi:uncharacterized protein (DUF885 family)